ncbi:MAG TPA: DUF4936 family protein [Janthinobacterium sp.]|jgi:hypothetical protein|nr:DUF4936 family protein [Janthinobacterium sp.]
MIDLYIYYQVRESDAAALLVRVREMQVELGARHAVLPSLKRRPDVKDGLQTWMEVYPATGDGFPAALESAVLDAGLAGLTAGPRHCEVFMDVITCA